MLMGLRSWPKAIVLGAKCFALQPEGNNKTSEIGTMLIAKKQNAMI